MSEVVKYDLSQWKVLNAIEEEQMKHHKVPSAQRIATLTGLTQEIVVDAMMSSEVQRALKVNGIDVMEDFSNQLTEEQIACLQMLYNFSDRRTKKDKLAVLGISPSKYQGWRRTKKFSEAERQVAENLWGEAMPQIHSSVVQQAIDGSIHHQKLAYAIMGRWDEKKNEAALNATHFLKQVFEILAEEVGDTATLERVARRFDGLMTPSVVQGSTLELE